MVGLVLWMKKLIQNGEIGTYLYIADASGNLAVTERAQSSKLSKNPDSRNSEIELYS